jgi:hypothetical protein
VPQSELASENIVRKIDCIVGSIYISKPMPAVAVTVTWANKPTYDSIHTYSHTHAHIYIPMHIRTYTYTYHTLVGLTTRLITRLASDLRRLA